MKTVTRLFFFLFLANGVNAQHKSGIVTYQIADINFVDKGVNMDVTNMLAMAKKQHYQLLFNGQKGSFIMKEAMSDESYSDFYNALAKTYVSNSDFYFDYGNGELIEVSNDGAVLESRLPKLDWQITSESKKIDQYLCLKATYSFNYYSSREKQTNTRVIIAWFAPSLPYSFGPKNFHGLPGLILELTENTVTFLASKIELLEKPIEIKFPSGKRIPKEQFEKAILKN